MILSEEESLFESIFCDIIQTPLKWGVSIFKLIINGIL